MYYVELLRSLRALRIVGILLGLLVIGTVIFRLTFVSGVLPEELISNMRNSPTAHVTETALPDGGSRIVIDDRPKKLHAVVERHGNSYSFQETEPTIVISVDAATHRQKQQTLITTNAFVLGPRYELGELFAMALPMSLIVLTLLAGPLAKESDGHLELAWTKPVSRERYALTALLIDAVTIVLAQVTTAIVIVLATAIWGFPYLSADRDAAAHVGLALLFPLAMYACLTAASAWLKRGPGTAIGVGWVVALVVPATARMTAEAHVPLWAAVHGLFSALSYADPVAYFWFLDAQSVAPAARSTVTALTSAAVLAVVYSAAAVLQWRRVEA